jgi:hypothetical protein
MLLRMGVRRLICVPRLLEDDNHLSVENRRCCFQGCPARKSALNPAAFFSALTTGQHELKKSAGAPNIRVSPTLVVDRQGEDTLYVSSNLAFRPPCCHIDESAEFLVSGLQC